MKFQSRLNFSSGIENFKRDLIFSIFWRLGNRPLRDPLLSFTKISLCTEIAAIFATCDCDATHRRHQKSLAISQSRQSNAALRFKDAMESR